MDRVHRYKEEMNMAKRETKAELKARVDHVLAALDQEYGTEYVLSLIHI